MSDEAKEVIQTVNQGHLPPLPPINGSPSKGTQVSQKGLNVSKYGLQSIKEGTQVELNNKNHK